MRRMVFALLFFMSVGVARAQEDGMAALTLHDIAEESISVTFYLAEVDITDGGGLGLPTYPRSAGKDIEPRYYRVLGIDPQHLVCKSALIVGLKIPVADAGIKCEEQPVKYVRIPRGDDLPYAEITWGHSLADHFSSEEDCGCGGAGALSDCSADLDVSVEGNGLRIEGSIDCGVSCDVNVRLTPNHPTSEASCTAGIFKTKFKLELDDDCVVVKGKACVKNLGGGYTCSDWIRIGRFCP
jgi:hypothetical protein